MAIDWPINRRGLVSGTLAALLGGALGWRGRAIAATQASDVNLISAARIDGVDGGAILRADRVTGFALPARAHGMVRLTSGEIVLVGRRPGSFAAIVDPRAPDDARVFGPPARFRFAGHGALAPDGATLATSEIDEETGEGRVVLRDAKTGRPTADFEAGIEPHDVLFTPDGGKVVVAIGGIAHAADIKGPAINAGKIDSAIVELDARTGAVLKRHQLPGDMRSLSLRHMALAADGETVAFGMQDQDRSRSRPVMGLLRLGRGIDLLPLPADDDGALRGYIGSVAFDVSGRYIAATSPKGGVVGLWSAADGRWLGGFKLADVCGLAAARDGGAFWVTSGFGDVMRLRASHNGFAAEAQWNAAAAFDNHLLRI
jgi:hypothetical protein